MEENKQSVNYDELSAQISELVAECSETNDRILELQEYFITKDKEEEKAKQEEEKTKEETKAIEEKQQADNTAKADEQTETYTELLTDVRDNIDLNNQLLSGTIFFMGVIFGLLFVKILWERFTK